MAVMVQGSLLDNRELLDSLDQAKAKSATINASLQESRNLQVVCSIQTVQLHPSTGCSHDCLGEQHKA